jgi:hypothetical protein
MSLADKLNDAIIGSRAFISDEVSDVTLDTVVSISRSSNSQVTRHAIEKGADVSDHVIDEPESWSLEVVLTNDQINPLNPLSFGGQTIEERLSILDTWRNDKTLLTYYGQQETIESVVVSSRSEVTNTDTGPDGLQVSITLQKVTLAEALTVDIEIKQPIPNTGLAASQSKSSTSTSPPTRKSMLRSLY